MDRTRIGITGALLLAAVLSTLSCASMRLTDEWRDRGFEAPPYRKIMVVVMSKRPDLRQPMEDEFARQIQERGGDASACYMCIPDLDKISREELVKVGTGMGIEAYLMVIVLRSEVKIESYRGYYSPPATGSYGVDTMMNTQLWGSPDPSMQKKSEVATLETLLYDGKSAKLVWRATIEATNPSGAGEISRFVRTVLSALGDQKLIR
ncbi:MAG: hypothetical protein LLG97_21670 [Deltaproteobacteria bacterium]|nr:hypothetical protein [Deltaproteobacteria bacterium]